jgi:phenylacetate-CoA ligase
MLVLESEYIAEVLEPNGDLPAPDGAVGELVITNLGRIGSPLIRYRTGDLVRAEPDPPLLPRVPRWLRLKGGVLGRADDMIHVRGNNLYPTAIEAVVRRFPEVVEFRIVIDQTGPLPDLRVEVEPSDPSVGKRLADAVARAVRDDLLFRIEVCPVLPGSLPRFEMKARRVVHRRDNSDT